MEWKDVFHKDRDPRETISVIRGILGAHGIFPIEEQWENVGRYVHSVRLEDVNLSFGTNGKGRSRILALASAYGEMLERIQAMMCFPFFYGRMAGERSFRRDVTERPFEAVFSECREIMEDLVELSNDTPGIRMLRTDSVLCAPFYNVTEDRVQDLPYSLINKACGSNGLSAGNTPSEALVEGMCEVAERYVIRQIISGRESAVPTIPLSDLSDLPVHSHLMNLLERGLEITVKDCSLGGQLPVVATLARPRGQSKYVYAFGSSPSLNVALVRCLTEQFQGMNISLLNGSLPWRFEASSSVSGLLPSVDAQRAYEFYAAYRTRSGRLPKIMFFDGGPNRMQAAFLDDYSNNNKALQFMVERLSRMGKPIFVRDHSWMGFPAYRVFIPGVSQVGVINRDCAYVSERRQHLGREVFGRLQTASEKDVKEIAEALENEGTYPRGAFDDITLWSSEKPGVREAQLLLDSESDLVTQFDTHDRFLAMLFYRAGMNEKASRYFQKDLESRPPDKVTMYEWCCAAYLQLRATEVSKVQIADELGNFYGKNVAEEVIGDLEDPSKIFQHYTLPECGNCSGCPVQQECHYQEWREVYEKLKKTESAISIKQESLRGVFKIKA